MLVVSTIFLCIISSKTIYVSTLSQSVHARIDGICPTICKCNAQKKSVVCSSRGKKLSVVPIIPKYVRKLTLDSNYFPRLNRSTFQDLSTTQLSELRMRDSNITNLDNDTFIDLQHLTSLDLEANRDINYTSFKWSMSSLRKENLSLIDLNKTGLNGSIMSLGIFTSLNGRGVDAVCLKRNHIEYLSKGSLRGLRNARRFFISDNLLQECDIALMELENLDYLEMENNKISQCDISNLPRKLIRLRMDRNYLERVPNFCSSLNTTSLPMLKLLSLEHNEINSIEQSSFRCLGALNYLSLIGNKISYFPSYVFNLFQNLQKLYLSYSKEPVTYINEGAFSIPTLKTLLFRGNNYNFRPLIRAGKASLRNNKDLEILDLSYNKLPVNDSGIKLLLCGLLSLKKLYMINVAWFKVPNSFFKLFPKLEELSLSHNSIDEITFGLFSKTFQVKLLRLDANGISYVGPNTFPEPFWKTVQILDLSGNPFACNCELLWFRDTLRQSHITFHEYPRKYVCVSPDKRKGLLLSQFDLHEEDCREKSVLPIAIIAFFLSFVFVFLVVVVIYRFRWQLRYFIYLWRYKEPKRMEIDDNELTYDAFIIYPEEDSHFVHDILLQKLENENDLRVCIHSRDFQPGKSIIENIVECIANSRRVLVVISSHFNKSKWCNFELLIAQDRWLNNESTIPLIIMREEVDNTWIKRDIRALVKTTTYAKWTEDVNGQELFWHQIISSVKYS